MLSLQPLFEFFGQTYDFFVQSDVFHGQLFQLVKQSQGFLSGQLPAVDGLDRLVVIHTHTAVVALQVREPDVEIHSRLVDFHDLQGFAENGRQDELRLGLRAGICVQPFELDVLHFVQTETVIIGMKLGFILGLAPALSGLCDGSLFQLAGLFYLSHRT